jgi:DNA end-binding protein Ku
MRSIWQGTLELGDVTIPVGIVPTVRDGGEKLKRLHEACKTPISLRSFCAREEELVEAADVVQAWEVAPGEYLVLEPEETAALQPEETRRVPIGCFFAIDDLDPVFVRARYWLAPSKTPVGRRAYAVFAEAMHELDVAALARFTWKGEKIGAVYSTGGSVLELLVLHFAEDVLPAEPILDELADAASPAPEVDLAKLLIGRHTRDLDAAADLVSVERPRMRELLEAKLAGQPIVRSDTAPPPEPGGAGDLTAALKSSLKHAPRARRRARAATS